MKFKMTKSSNHELVPSGLAHQKCNENMSHQPTSNQPFINTCSPKNQTVVVEAASD
jgi:hypothetical protein